MTPTPPIQFEPMKHYALFQYVKNGSTLFALVEKSALDDHEEFPSTTDNDSEIVIMSSKIVNPKVFRVNHEQIGYLLSQIINRPSCWNAPTVHIFRIQILPPRQYFLDYKSNMVSTVMVMERCELENCLNWLSTLGGAFSALGENDMAFASRAGKISRSQMLIALKLGSPTIMCRCRLYAAISLIQLNKLKPARFILLREYEYCKSLPADSDPRLKKMCVGIWAKLKYDWKSKRQLK